VTDARAAVVTGGSRGIGASVARRLAADGYRVIAAARSMDAPADAADASAVSAMRVDVSDPAQVDDLCRAACALGALRVWVNCAAVLDKVPFADMTPERWRRTLAVDLDGVFHGCAAAFRAMRGHGGVIVNIASLSGVANVEKFPGLSAYNVAKAGVIALTEAVALEGREHGIVCICVSPGAVDTGMLRAAAPHLHPGMTPDDAAAIITWLTTPAAAPLSGTNIPIFSNA
jgi:NAD(P)-dependent dehydrogenase (short-subunit alcohol dehydrogenase family)